jgi:hypothetical protein
VSFEFQKFKHSADSGELIHECAYCDHPSVFQLAGQSIFETRVDNPEKDAKQQILQYYVIGTVFRCRKCGNPLFMRSEGTSNKPLTQVVKSEFWPRHVPKMPNGLPSMVARAFEEAHKCFAANAFNGCATMCRRAVEEVCIDKQAVGKDLHARIKVLEREHGLSKGAVELAQMVRVLGRDGAHADDPNGSKTFLELNEDDARQALDFCDVLFNYVYELPERIESATNKRPA